VSGGLFGVGVGGTALTASERRILAASPPFGVILFRRNVESAEQVRALVASVRALGVRLIFLDQEGGPVDRLRDLIGPSPSFARAAAAGQARGAGALAGAALTSLDVDVDLAPVVDRALPAAGADVLGERCASDDAGAVIRAAAEFLGGLHDEGVGGCLKHFPGLGRARLDTHLELPVVPEDRHQEALDLAPFDALMTVARAVMISHAADPDGRPASLSFERATVLLRDILGFDGAAFSDDLEMGALAAFGTLPERSTEAAAAGCDLLFICKQIEGYPDCVAAVEKGVPPERRAQAAARLEEYAAHLAALPGKTRRARTLPLAEVAEGLRRLNDLIGETQA
jgi:beta-N-acetylhexosaminidase